MCVIIFIMKGEIMTHNTQEIDFNRDVASKFKNLSLLDTALTSGGYARDNGVESYQRLEFLGDAILNAVSAKLLYNLMPDADEGVLTDHRSVLVCKETLAKFAYEMGLDKHARRNSGEMISQSTMEDMFEAIVGAIYIDRGYDAAEQFLLDIFNDYCAYIVQDQLDVFGIRAIRRLESKLHLQESDMNIRSVKSGEKQFVAEVLVDGTVAGQAFGKSESSARTNAAKEVLDNWGWWEWSSAVPAFAT